VRGYGQYCPIALTLDLLGDKWTLLIVRELLRGKRRFRDIEAGLPGIPPNLLSDRLRVLEQAKVVNREYFRELPPRVEYSLTERGAKLELVLESLASWGMAYMMGDDLPCENVDLDLFFFHLPRFFCSDKAAGVDATVEVRLTGERGGSWWIRVHDGACTVHREPITPVAAVIECDAGIWIELMAVHRDPPKLAGAPGVCISGDLDLARRFGSFFCKDSPLPVG
jgi:DNA-binding HxlR family transcriptional regulator